jgi:ABC-2 type transport system ATP-binding protein
LCGRLYGLGRQETDTRAIELLRHLDLEQGRTTIVEKASFGMRKKCALAMALLHNPRVLFLDEPFEGIDPGSSRNIKDLLLALAERGVSVFLTSHILEIVERLAERFCAHRHGGKSSAASPSRISDAPERRSSSYTFAMLASPMPGT